MIRALAKHEVRFLILGFFLCAGWLTQRSLQASTSHLFPFYDEVWYLDHARALHNQGFISGIAEYLNGNNREDNQHPLYLFALSALMNNTTGDFTRAKLFSCAQCWFVLIILMVTVYRRAGIEGSLVCALLFSCASGTIHLSQMILADILFGLLFFLACSKLSEPTATRGSWFIVGILCGLSYLTKGNGHLLLVIALGASAESMLAERRPNTSAALVAAGFLVTAGFLLWRNTLVWHNPLHHLNNKMFWLNDWQESFFYKLTPEWNDVGMRWYFAHHSYADALRRLFSGAARQFATLLETTAFVSFENRWRFACGGAIVVLSAMGLWRRFKNGFRREVVIAICGMLIIFVPFSFFVEQTVRYCFPIMLLLLPYAAMELSPLIKKCRPMTPLLFCGAIVSIAMAARAAYLNPPASLYKMPAYWRETTEWIERNAPTAKYAIDTWSPYSEWDCCADKRMPVPYEVREDLLRLFIAKNNLHLAVVDRLRIISDPFQTKYGPSDEYGPTSFLDWPRLFHDDNKPSHFLIYGFLTDQPGQLRVQN